MGGGVIAASREGAGRTQRISAQYIRRLISIQSIAGTELSYGSMSAGCKSRAEEQFPSLTFLIDFLSLVRE